MYGEELDWCLRMKQAGLQAAFYPGARCHPSTAASSSGTHRGELAPAGPGRAAALLRKAPRRSALYWPCGLLTVLGMPASDRPAVRSLWPGDAARRLDWYWGLLRVALAPCWPAALSVSNRRTIQHG